MPCYCRFWIQAFKNGCEVLVVCRGRSKQKRPPRNGRPETNAYSALEKFYVFVQLGFKNDEFANMKGIIKNLLNDDRDDYDDYCVCLLS